jgi:hypothetical protein
LENTGGFARAAVVRASCCDTFAFLFLFFSTLDFGHASTLDFAAAVGECQGCGRLSAQ